MGKEIDLSRKTITEDKNGNALITGKATASVQPTDNNDLTTKLYVDNAIDNKLAGLTMIKITQAEYDALATKDPNTLYLIVE